MTGTGELRGGNRPSLDQALGWIGSRVDDIYGSSVGRLEDVWIDPGTGAPKWLLVKEGHFGGRTTLIPFGDATAGAGHVWVPYEREIVRDAPAVEPGTPLTHDLEATLSAHFSRTSAADPAPAPPVAAEPAPRPPAPAVAPAQQGSAVPPESAQAPSAVSGARLHAIEEPPAHPPSRQSDPTDPQLLEGTFEVEFTLGGITIKGQVSDLKLRRVDGS